MPQPSEHHAAFVIALPWPASVLRPNVRAHWSMKAAAAKKARADACYLACASVARKLGWGGAAVAITFNPPDNRRRDLDGMLSSLKSALDGIADATGIDDSRWSIAMTRGDPVKGGAVVVEIQEAGFRNIGEVAAGVVADVRTKQARNAE